MRIFLAFWAHVVILGFLCISGEGADAGVDVVCVQKDSQGAPVLVPSSRINDNNCDCIENGADEPEVSPLSRC